ncbi:M23 family metallopeptidase [Fundidesulfovibrio butyratiphilus]
MPHSSGFEIFRDEANRFHRATVKRWPVAVFLAALVFVGAANIWWYASVSSLPAMEEEVAGSDKSKARLAQNVERLDEMSQEIATGVKRLHDADAKLREMISLDKEAKTAAQSDDAVSEVKRESDLQLTRLEVQEAYSRLLSESTRAERLDAAQARLLGADPGLLLGEAPDAWPVEGVISSGFGVRLSPFANREEFHKGVDIMAPSGSPVRSPAPGRVIFAGQDAEGELAVMLDHGGGYVTSFSHIQDLAVRYGDKIERGRTLGLVGQDGRSTGPHLHYEVRLRGAPVDPRVYLP